MQLSVRQSGTALVIDVLEDRLDAAVAIAFKEAVRDAITRPGAPVILNMARVDFLDSSGLGAVVAVMKMLGADRPLQLAALSSGVLKVFRLTRMDTVFTLLDRSARRDHSRCRKLKERQMMQDPQSSHFIITQLAARSDTASR